MSATASPGPAARTQNLLRRADFILREAKLKVTDPRKKVLKVLMEKHGPLSIDEIRRSMRKGECDLVTVYRSVAALEERGLVARCDFGDGVARFEYGTTGEHHHHHIICRNCKDVAPFEVCVDPKWKALLEQKGYSDLSHNLEFFGVCSNCRNHPRVGSRVRNPLTAPLVGEPTA